jgi:hypothetical protein
LAGRAGSNILLPSHCGGVAPSTNLQCTGTPAGSAKHCQHSLRNAVLCPPYADRPIIERMKDVKGMQTRRVCARRTAHPLKGSQTALRFENGVCCANSCVDTRQVVSTPQAVLRMEFCCAKLRAGIRHLSLPRRGLKPLRGLRMEFATQTPCLYPLLPLPRRGMPPPFHVTPPPSASTAGGLNTASGVENGVCFLTQWRVFAIVML